MKFSNYFFTTSRLLGASFFYRQTKKINHQNTDSEASDKNNKTIQIQAYKSVKADFYKFKMKCAYKAYEEESQFPDIRLLLNSKEIDIDKLPYSETITEKILMEYRAYRFRTTLILARGDSRSPDQ